MRIISLNHIACPKRGSLNNTNVSIKDSRSRIEEGADGADTEIVNHIKKSDLYSSSTPSQKQPPVKRP